MKKIIKICLSLFMMCLFSSSTLLANEEDNNINNGNKSIEYSEELGGYILENITVEEVLSAFDSSDEFVRTGELKETTETTPTLARALNISPKAKNYTADYYLSITVKGVESEDVKVNYTCNMVMTTLTYQGRNYAQFVSFNLKPTAWLSSGKYKFGAGTGSPKYQIKDSGATISISQIIQLETSSTISVDVGWINIGSGTSERAYFRSTAKTYSTYTRLPLYNVIY